MARNKRKRVTKSSAIDFSNFDENILFEILKRLEADTLYNLRVVCKQWYDLIFYPQFANSNLSYAKRGILFQIPGYGSYALSFIDMKEGKFKVHDLNVNVPKPVRASSNGLVLVDDLPKPRDLSVVNLLTRKGIKIPLHTCNLLLDAIGFTYIPQTREYKIVCQMFDEGIRFYVYKILTLGSNEWRQVDGPQLATMVKEPISINNFVHSLITEEDDQDFLFSIDTADETSHEIELPDLMPIGHSRNLMDLGGVLALVIGLDHDAEVWVLDDFYKKQWIRRHRIILQVERFGRKDYLESAELIGSLGNGKVILFVNRFSCYVADVELQHVKILPHVKAYRFHCIPYLSSLISWKSL